MSTSYEMDYQKGAFLSMKSVNLVEKGDIAKYEGYSYNILKMQGCVMLYSTFLARMFDIGNVIKGFKTHKYGFYGAFISIPCILHAIYAGILFNGQVESLDKKYTYMYLNYQTKKV